MLCCVTLNGAAQPDSSEPYRMACRLELERQPGLTTSLEDRIAAQIRKSYEAVLGSEVEFRFVRPDEVGYLAKGALESLGPEPLLEHWSSMERLLLVHVRQEQGVFVCQAREFDPQFQILGPCLESRLMQRDMLVDAVGRLALRGFSPTAQVRAAQGRIVQVEFQAGEQIRPYRSWLGLEGKFGLQVMREPVSTERSDVEPRPVRYRRSFLSLVDWGPERAECALVGPDTHIFQDLSTPAVRFLARPARAPNGQATIRVVRRGTSEPQEGCEVFVSPEQYSTEPDLGRGITDRAGLVRLDLSVQNVQFVSVRYEDLVLKAPLLAGASPNPLVFELPTSGRRSEYVRPLKQIFQELEDQRLRDRGLIEELQARAQDKNVAEVRKLLDRGDGKRMALETVIERVREIEYRAEHDGEDVSALASEVREFAAKQAAQPLQQVLASFREWSNRQQKDDTIRALATQINQLQRDMDWAGLVPLYQRLVAEDPENPEYAKQLRRLQNDLRVKDADHEQSRTFVDTQLAKIDSHALADQWPEIEQATHALLVAKDHLSLLKVRRSMTQWARDLAAEVQRLIDQLKAAADDAARVEQLQTELQRIKDQYEALQKLHQEVQAFLEELDL
jgi:hypothetical protein